MVRLFWLLLAARRLAPVEAQRTSHDEFGQSTSECSDSVSFLQVGAPAPRFGWKRLPVVIPLHLELNSSGGDVEFTLAGVVSAWHPDPILWTYFAHTVATLLAALLALYRPSMLLALGAAALAVWPVLVITRWTTWGVVSLSLEWWLLLCQQLLALAAAAVPLVCLVWRRAELTRAAGFATLLILEASMLWTLSYPSLSTDWVLVQLSSLCMLSLCLTLLVRICVLWFGDINPFCIEKTTVVLCPGCSLSWAVCYTVWNVVWAAQHGGPGATLAHILLWVVMFLFLSVDAQKARIENYFVIAHGISSCTWLELNRWMGLAHPFRDAEDTTALQPNTYILFISVMNFVYSFYVMYWEVYITMRPEQGGITQLLRQKSFQGGQQDPD